MATLEKQTENEILNFLNAIGIFCWKNQSTGIYDPVKKIYRRSFNKNHIKGTSDILGIVKGRLLAIEVKSQKGIVSPEQKEFIAKINANGGVAFVARSLHQACLELNEHFPENQFIKRTLESNWRS